MTPRFTVLGSRGYVGYQLTEYLKSLEGAEVITDSGELPKGNLGHIFYCIGVTTDFKSRLHDTMRAHVSKLMEVLESCPFDSFTYLSSTRVYEGGSSGDETASLTSDPSNIADYYKISKIAGEAVCLSHQLPTVRVVRLSNVLGMELPPLTFIPSLIRDALNNNRIVLETALDSAKDYIVMEDVVRMLPLIATGGQHRIYNLASGLQASHSQIVAQICEIFQCPYETRAYAKRVVFPEVNNLRLRDEFGFSEKPILECLRSLCYAYKAIDSIST